MTSKSGLFGQSAKVIVPIDNLQKGGCMGIDPGGSGGIAYAWDGGAQAWAIGKLTPHEQWEVIFDISRIAKAAAIEKVGAMPKQGVSSTFKFGKSAGSLEAFLVAARIRFDWVTPAKWQNDMHCRSGGDKNVTKSAAQQLWPHAKITHALADALLIAEFCRIHAPWGK